jgi:hypothetical protein
MKLDFNDIDRLKSVLISVLDYVKSLEKKDREGDYGKHLIFHIPVDAATRGIKVYTSDGQDLSNYFRIVSIDSADTKADKFSTITITLEASLG